MRKVREKRTPSKAGCNPGTAPREVEGESALLHQMAELSWSPPEITCVGPFHMCMANCTVVTRSLCLQCIKRGNTISHLGIMCMKRHLTSHQEASWEQHQNATPASPFPPLPPLYKIPFQQAPAIGMMVNQGVSEVYSMAPAAEKRVCRGQCRVEASIGCKLALILPTPPHVALSRHISLSQLLNSSLSKLLLLPKKKR